MTRTLSIIGTAGRKDDAPKLSKALYDAMYGHVLEVIAREGATHLVSGGAAWADHLAVRAFLDPNLSLVQGLTLYLPANFEGGRYIPDPSVQFNPGKTSNYYHDQFSRAIGTNTFSEIARAAERGANLVVEPGFFNRNASVSRSEILLAFTFGADEAPATFRRLSPGFRDPRAAGLKDGGTSDTWKKATASETNRKIHVSLTWLARQVARSGSLLPT